MSEARLAPALVLLFTFVVGCAGDAGSVAKPTAPNGWNVLLVSVDTLRADHLSSYGATALSTPRIDEIAATGILFDDVTTVSPTTLPAHASLLTGRTPLRHGLRENVGFYLSSDTPTLAGHLKAHGYETAGFVGAFVLDARFGIANGFETWDDELGAEADALDAGIVAQRRGEAVASSALRWLEGRAGDPRPFFAFVHFYDPHTPYDAPGRDDRERYQGEVVRVDGLVGRLLDGLRSRGYGESTIVVLTSDHGEALGDHGELTHGLFLYQATMRIPLLIHYPGSPKGERVNGLARITDVAPTIVDLLGLPSMSAPDGESLRGRIERPDEPSETTAYGETFLPRLQYGWSELRSLRRGRFKFVEAPRPELYDLEADPGESRNLVSDEPELADDLEAELDARVRNEASIDPSPIDAETRRKLESLGYTATGSRENGRPEKPDRPERDDPKDRLELYLALNDTTLEDLAPGDEGFEEELARAAKLVREAPAVPRAYVLYGDLLLRAGRLAEAEANFEALSRLEPGSFDASLGLGVARARAGKLSEASAALERAHELEPRNTKAHFQLASVARVQGDLESAERWLRHAIAIAPDRFLVAQLASVLEQAGKASEALALLTERRDRSPEDPVAWYQLGQHLLAEGDAAGAIPILRKSIELGPDDPDAHQALGSALAASGDGQGAVASFQKALALSPCHTQALSNLGSAYAGLGRSSEAIESFQKAVACDPGYALGYKNLAAMEMQRGNLHAAVEAMRRAVAASPDDAELRKTLDELVVYERSRR